MHTTDERPPRRIQLPPVVYEDRWLVAFHKPAGLLSVPDRFDKALPNLIQLAHAKYSPLCFNVQRLDKDTSGVLLCARDKDILKRICGRMQSGHVHKTYLALVVGAPKEPRGRILLPIGPDARIPGRMKVVRSGKPCETVYELRERWRHYSLLQAEPVTGRTHQVRVHLAAQGCPIVADSFYGDGQGLLLSRLKRHYRQKGDTPEKPLIGRLALHAESLAFEHPVTDEPVTIRAPLPKDFDVALKYLRRFG